MLDLKQTDRMLRKLERFVDIIEPMIFEKVGEPGPVSAFATLERFHCIPEDSLFDPIEKGYKWGEEFGYCWFKTDFVVPDGLGGKDIFIRPHISGYEGTLWVDGVPYGNFSTKIVFTGHGNHYCDLLKKDAKAGEKIAIDLEYYAGHSYKGCHPTENNPLLTYDFSYEGIDICVKNYAIQEFYFDLRTLVQLVKNLPENSFRRASVINELEKVFKEIYQSPDDVDRDEFMAALERAKPYLKKALSVKNGDDAPKAALIGHSHMDTAWLWHVGETVKKCARTYANQLALMDEYPEYKFIQSSSCHSDFLRRKYPDLFARIQQKVKEGSDPEKPEYETVEEMKTVNSMVPLWQRKKSDVTDEEYNKFYSELTHEFDKPQRTITVSAEGSVTYKALLFVPSSRPFNFYTEGYEKGLQLYSAGVLIMDKCDSLLPDYLRFVRGVVDSPDLSLNISRELLQHDRQLKVIGQNLEKKVRADLEKFLKDDREGYEKFYENFGRQIGYGIVSDGGESRKDSLKDLMMFYSSTQKKLTTLKEYVERMKEDQKCIYYAAGESIAAVDKLPQTELLKDKDYEVLYLTGETDEFVLQALMNYDEKPFRSIVDGDLELGDEEEHKDDSESAELMQFVKETLGDKIKEAKVSHRLKTHPVCLTAGEGFSFEMEKYFKNFQMPEPIKAERILELNVDHPAVKAMAAALATDRDKAALYAKILYDQANLIAGLPLEDPSAYTDMVAQLMQ